jgi:hypothetical protein
MSPHEPAGESRESWIDRQIREAQERGDFDDLPGKGKPLPDLHGRGDDLWWVRRKLKDEGLEYLPPALRARKDVEEARRRIAAATSEHDVRDIVAAINERIREVNRTVLHGPASTLALMDGDAEVRRWQAGRSRG